MLAWVDGAPLSPADAGRAAGNATLGRWFLGCLVAAFAAYLAGLWLLHRRGARLGAVALVAAAIQLAPLAGPLLLSTDSWTYWEYGRIAAVEGGNPYRDEPREFPGNPAYPFAGAAWRDTTSVYGPLFTLASEPIALAAGDSEDAAAWIYKALAAGAMLAATALAARRAREKALAAAFVGWNPLLAVHMAGGGHNDAWLAALVLAAVVLAAAGRRQLAGVAWAAAIGVKWVPAVLLAMRALEARGTRRRVGHAGFAAGAAAVSALAVWRYGLDWLGAFGPLARNAGTETSYALPHRLEQLGLAHDVAIGLALSLLAVALALLARQALRGRARLGLTACVLLLGTPWLAAWYVAWAVPLAAAEEDRTAQLAALGLCAYLLPQAVPL